MHLEDDFIKPADFVDEDDLHSLGVFMPGLAVDIPGVTLDQFDNPPRNVKVLIAQRDVAQ